MSDTKECPFCAETIKAAAKKCKHCGECLDGHTRESVLVDMINTGNLNDVKGAAIGSGAQAFSTGDVENFTVTHITQVYTDGKQLRDKQYEIALDWIANGKPRMRGFDLSGHNLKGVKWIEADLQDANLSESDLSNATLFGADMTGANLTNTKLSKAKYNSSTKWPVGYKPIDAGAEEQFITVHSYINSAL